MRATALLLLIFGFAVVGFGCEDPDEPIVVYQAPKDARSTPPQAAAPTSGPVEVAMPPAVESWSVPADWVAQPAKQMRLATFKTSNAPTAAEVIVSQFPANAFGDLVSNVNRWRKMVGLPDIKDASEAPPEKLKVAGDREADAYDFSGTQQPPQRVRIVMLASPDGKAVWFFRLQSAADEVGRSQPVFDSFVQSIRLKQ